MQIDELVGQIINIEDAVERRFDRGEQPAPGSDMEAQMAAYHRLARQLRSRDPHHPVLSA